MRFEKHLFLVCLLVTPPLLGAEEQKGHAYTAREHIAFVPSSQAAFDRSGRMVKDIVLPDGSVMAEHNGSLGNVTVARMGADGSVETYCTTDAYAAKSWMAGNEASKSAVPLNVLVEEK